MHLYDKASYLVCVLFSRTIVYFLWKQGS